MNLDWTHRLRVSRKTAPATMDEHHAMRTIGRLLVISITTLVVSCVVMLTTGQMVKGIYEQTTAEAEHVRAANGIDLLVSQFGPLTPEGAETIGRIAGLKNAYLSQTAPTAPDLRMIPLLGEQAVSGSYLVWTENSFGNDMFKLFAPIRLPTVSIMLLIVIGMMVYVHRLVSDIERQRRLAHRQSRTDVVTGLDNRLAFETAIGRLSQAGTPFGIVIIDLDLFKAVNDALGHAAGDIVLRTVGQRLEDLMGPGDQLARLGGDEFVMVRVNKPDPAGLSILARECIFAIEQPIELTGGRNVKVGASLGIVAAGSGDLPPSTLLGAADTALYRAKAQPGSAFQFAGDSPASADHWHLRCA